MILACTACALVLVGPDALDRYEATGHAVGAPCPKGHTMRTHREGVGGRSWVVVVECACGWSGGEVHPVGPNQRGSAWDLWATHRNADPAYLVSTNGGKP